MERQPVAGRFGLGLSYGLPSRVLVAGFLALIIDEPDMRFLSWLGIGVTVAVALFVMRRQNSEPND